MSPTKAPIVFLICLIAFVTLSWGKKRVTIDAATTFMEGFIMFIAGDEVVILFNHVEMGDNHVLPIDVQRDMSIHAAVTVGDSLKIDFYGPTYFYRVDMGTDKKARRFNYNGPLKRFRDGGPDAAASIGGSVYYFKDCKVIKRNKKKKFGKAKNLAKLGLPCNPDAAWKLGDGMTIVILKGDQIWFWGQGNNVEGPIDFSSVYTLTSWELIP